MIAITLPLSQAEVIAITIAADTFGVAPWEMAIHVLALRQELNVRTWT